jgi:VanZ family protein
MNVFSLIPFILWSVLMLFLTLTPSESNSDSVALVPVDKAVHFALFFVWTILFVIVDYKTIFLCKRWSQLSIRILLIGLLFGGMIELIQWFVPGRNFSLFDMLANIGGISFGCAATFFGKLLVRRK